MAYRIGWGVVPQDYPTSVEWYRLAAEQGRAEAQFHLGGTYGLGQGVPEDPIQAHKWPNLAASRMSGERFEEIKKTRDLLAAEMSVDQLDTARRLAAEWRPSTTEAEFWQAFRQDCPKILGALLDCLVHGLQQLPTTRLNRHPRMADFARWATACETAVWPAGTFIDAYMGNRAHTVDSVIEADQVASTVRAWMADRTDWSGTASDLRTSLSEHAGAAVTNGKTWPSTPRALSGRLRRAATFLRTVGVHIDFDQKVGRNRTRLITIATGPDQSVPSTSAPSAAPPMSVVAGAGERAIPRTVGRPADATRPGADGQHNSESPPNTRGTGARTVADAKIPPNSAGWRGRR